MISNFSDFFKAAGDDTRQRIINLLLNYPVLNVNDMVRILNIPQSKISRHLSVLRHAEWLVFSRRDKWVYYRINPKLGEQLLEAFKNVFKQHLKFENDLKRAQDIL